MEVIFMHVLCNESNEESGRKCNKQKILHFGIGYRIYNMNWTGFMGSFKSAKCV